MDLQSRFVDSAGGIIIDQPALQVPSGRLIKKPAGTRWFKQTDSGAGEVADIKCPDGSRPEAVTTAGYLKF